MRRYDQTPVPFLKGWKNSVHPTFSIPRAILEKAIQESGLTMPEIKNCMGAGYIKLENALDGQLLDSYEVRFLEGCLGIHTPTEVALNLKL